MRDGLRQGARWRKAELHSHCSVDPLDYRVCNYTPEQLIARAAGLGYEILALTCHNLDIWSRELAEYAESLGVLLIPGMEVTAEGTRHLLAYNFKTGCENLSTLEKIRNRSREDTMVIAPHPFYPGNSCFRNRIGQNLDLFDALEVSGFHTPLIDFNDRTREFAAHHEKPMVGNADVHFLWQLGRTFTWIHSEPDVQSVLDAVKQGQVRVETSPLSPLRALEWWAVSIWRTMFPVNPRPRSRPLKPVYD